MRILLQRVNRASVSVEGETVGSIGKGLLILAGVAIGDTDEDVNYLADKAVNTRIFPDSEDKFNLSLLDVSGECLVVSQFTLLADTRRGRRPSFSQAAPPEVAERLFELFVARVRDAGIRVATGRFQQKMLLDIHNDGPVTIMINSRERFLPRRAG